MVLVAVTSVSVNGLIFRALVLVVTRRVSLLDLAQLVCCPAICRQGVVAGPDKDKDKIDISPSALFKRLRLAQTVLVEQGYAWFLWVF